MNKARSDTLRDAAQAVIVYGFNGWESGSRTADMVPAPNLPIEESDEAQWVCAPVQIPADAYEMNTAFSSKDGTVWDKCARVL